MWSSKEQYTISGLFNRLVSREMAAVTRMGMYESLLHIYHQRQQKNDSPQTHLFEKDTAKAMS